MSTSENYQQDIRARIQHSLNHMPLLEKAGNDAAISRAYYEIARLYRLLATLSRKMKPPAPK